MCSLRPSAQPSSCRPLVKAAMRTGCMPSLGAATAEYESARDPHWAEDWRRGQSEPEKDLGLDECLAAQQLGSAVTHRELISYVQRSAFMASGASGMNRRKFVAYACGAIACPVMARRSAS